MWSLLTQWVNKFFNGIFVWCHTSLSLSLVNAFGLNGQGSRAVDLYISMPRQMHNEITNICVLNACSHSGLLNEARFIFEKISPKTVYITTAMVSQLNLSFQPMNCLFSIRLIVWAGYTCLMKLRHWSTILNVFILLMLRCIVSWFLMRNRILFVGESFQWQWCPVLELNVILLYPKRFSPKWTNYSLIYKIIWFRRWFFSETPIHQLGIRIDLWKSENKFKDLL